MVNEGFPFNGLFFEDNQGKPAPERLNLAAAGLPIWILMKQEMMGGSGISSSIWKSFAPHFRQITRPAPHHSVFYRMDALPDAQPTGRMP